MFSHLAKDHGRYRPIEVIGATDTRVEGLTIADSATHSLMLVGPYKAGHPNEVKWTKIFTWRANGDGINPFGNTLIENCFIRTQDDSLYVTAWAFAAPCCGTTPTGRPLS